MRAGWCKSSSTVQYQQPQTQAKYRRTKNAPGVQGTHCTAILHTGEPHADQAHRSRPGTALADADEKAATKRETSDTRGSQRTNLESRNESRLNGD